MNLAQVGLIGLIILVLVLFVRYLITLAEGAWVLTPKCVESCELNHMSFHKIESGSVFENPTCYCEDLGGMIRIVEI